MPVINGSNTARKTDLSRWIGSVITALTIIVVVSMQWGATQTRLDGANARLDELLAETRSLRESMHELEMRVAVIERRRTT